MQSILIKSHQLIDTINASAKIVNAKTCIEKYTKLKIRIPVSNNAQNIRFIASKSFGDTPGSKIDFAIALNIAQNQYLFTFN